MPQHFSQQTSLRVRSTEDEDSPKGYRSPKPATHSGAGREALFAGAGGQLGVFRQTASAASARERRIAFAERETHGHWAWTEFWAIKIYNCHVAFWKK